MIRPKMKQVMGDGVAIQLADWGGQGKTVLCVHGLTSNCRCWDRIAEPLSPRHRILAMDLRGRGHSGSPPAGYDIGRHCQDIKALLHNLGLNSVVLMGHSLGAFITLTFAAHYPQQVECIILVDGGGQLPRQQFAKVLAGIKPALERLGKVFPSLEDYYAGLKQAPFLQPWSPALETYFGYEVEEAPGGIRSRIQPAVIQEELLNLQKFDVAGLYPMVRCPVLILRAEKGTLAEDDILLPGKVLERMLREIPNARYMNVKDTNHYTIMFEPHAVRDQTIMEFIGEG